MTAATSPLTRGSSSADDTAIALRLVADLLQAGLPATKVIQSLETLAPARWVAATPELLRGVREGGGLSVAMESSGLGLPPEILGLIKAGERSGDLAGAIRRAADIAEASARHRAAVRAALAYPAIIAAVGLIAVLALVLIVLPRFARVIEGMGQSLPASTTFVLNLADTLRNWWMLLLGAVALVWVALALRLRTPDGRREAERLLLAMPGIGEVRWAAASARFASLLSAMLSSGIALRMGLRYASEGVGNAAIAERLVLVRKRMDGGEPFARALGAEQAVTPLTLRLAAAGEVSGRLPEMLQHAARLEQERAERKTQQAVRLLEPALILGLAAFVGLFAVAMLQAVYAVRPS